MAQDIPTPLSPVPPSADALSFENALRELESIVQKLERGDVALDESIALYARGEALRTQCQQRLADAEARIEKLTLGAGNVPVGTEAFRAD
ncbi:MAG: exodeoxyribonuclease VII small subunit [Sphingobium sp.]|nr:exodeoxyribonuclease VII small subunit [Sphingobium sp.]MBP6112915.1 exodeoxyribonuclease VII small subunit [Sphingobium sp.]MBP8671388.1 exodeoxyribonuclease VII small subunit [Sphingobium sp.]MBP9156283.1 exodeoxyribonuclease VII small subunit [Sphingobium sp.]MCC6482573.1 exodeoxyribonuclease VII small subunit [Sphingomonadaceae bacterium]